MICPYNGFTPCRWRECAARMLVKDPVKNGYMEVCGIAYNGGTVYPAPNRMTYEPEEKPRVSVEEIQHMPPDMAERALGGGRPVSRHSPWR